MLRQLNLSEFIMTSFEDYQNLAVNLVKKSRYLEGIKKNLTSRHLASKEFSPVIFMNAYENTLLKISIEKNK